MKERSKLRKIIIIEDDKTIREELGEFLQRYGYEIKAFDDFNDILGDLRREEGDLILLDINLPKYDGYYICREVRKNSDIPIIVVTSRDTDMDELMSINLGADDFITKPYNTEILLARISSLLKRTYGNNLKDSVISYKGLKLNLSNASVSYDDKTLELTKNEIKMLSCFIKNKGKIVSRERLMEHLWKSNCFVDDSTLSVNITRLRKKLCHLGMENPIETRRGLGYIMP